MSDLYPPNVDPDGYMGNSRNSRQVPQAQITTIFRYADFQMRRNKANAEQGKTIYPGMFGTGCWDIKDGEPIFSIADASAQLADPYGELQVLSSFCGISDRLVEKDRDGNLLIGTLLPHIRFQGISYTDRFEEDQTVSAPQITGIVGGAVSVRIHTNFMPGDQIYGLPPTLEERRDPLMIRTDFGNPENKVTLKLKKVTPLDASELFHQAMTRLLERPDAFDRAVEISQRNSKGLKKALLNMQAFVNQVVVVWEYVKARRDILDPNSPNARNANDADQAIRDALKLATGLKVINPDMSEDAIQLTAGEKTYYENLGKELQGAVFWNGSTNLMFGKIGEIRQSNGRDRDKLRANGEGSMIQNQKNMFSMMLSSFMQFDEQMDQIRVGTAITAGTAGERGTVRLKVC